MSQLCRKLELALEQYLAYNWSLIGPTAPPNGPLRWNNDSANLPLPRASIKAQHGSEMQMRTGLYMVQVTIEAEALDKKNVEGYVGADGMIGECERILLEDLSAHILINALGLGVHCFAILSGPQTDNSAESKRKTILRLEIPCFET
jgi:hypothetical protein